MEKIKINGTWGQFKFRDELSEISLSRDKKALIVLNLKIFREL